MKHLLFILAIFLNPMLQAQHTISGTFSPAKDYSWIIAYRLKPDAQVYVADTAIQDGKFTLSMPKDIEIGTYRLVYAVPQEEFYFDVIYNGKENIELAFNIADGVSFTASEENKCFQSYFKTIADLEQQIIDFYVQGNTDKNKLDAIAREMGNVQKTYEEKSIGMVSNHFIKANYPYIPSNKESVFDYVQNKKEHYFDVLGITNPVLQASDFLSNKLANYVFTALPLEPMSKEETEDAIKANVDTINVKARDVTPKYKLHLFYTLWSQAAGNGQNKVSDYIYRTYLKELAEILDDHGIISTIDSHNRLRIGAQAPDIYWKNEGTEHRLSSLDGVENYILVFWSSTCSHCLRELPALHNRLKGDRSIKVIAVGLEEEDNLWKQETAKMEHFEHAISLGKWESEYADLYDIHQTPTYFILDRDKRIMAKPESDKDVVEFLEGMD